MLFVFSIGAKASNFWIPPLALFGVVVDLGKLYCPGRELCAIKREALVSTEALTYLIYWIETLRLLRNSDPAKTGHACLSPLLRPPINAKCL